MKDRQQRKRRPRPPASRGQTHLFTVEEENARLSGAIRTSKPKLDDDGFYITLDMAAVIEELLPVRTRRGTRRRG